MKKTVTILLALLLCVLLAACGGQTQESGSEVAAGAEAEASDPAQTEEATPMEADTERTAEEAPAQDDGTISYTMYFVDPETSPYAEGGQKIAELVSAATDGKIRITVVAGAEQGERELIEGAMDNKIDIATCANSVLTNYIPQMNILDQAYLWKNADEAHAAVDGMLGDLIRARAETLGLHVIGFEESGFRNTFSVKPIQSMADFEGVTIRTMENKYHQAAFESFGATPIAMAYGMVFPALESGEIDACENATANCLNSGYYEVTRNVTNTQHAFVYIVLCMSDEAWNRLPEELRTPFMEAVQEGVAWERNRLNEANAEATVALKELGVSFYDIDMAELQAAYQKIAEERGFEFDREWQNAVDEAIRQAAAAATGDSPG